MKVLGFVILCGISSDGFAPSTPSLTTRRATWHVSRRANSEEGSPDHARVEGGAAPEEDESSRELSFRDSTQGGLRPLAARASRRKSMRLKRAQEMDEKRRWKASAGGLDEIEEAAECERVLRAHTALYRAMNQRSLGGMRRLWATGGDVHCTHPLFADMVGAGATGADSTAAALASGGGGAGKAIRGFLVTGHELVMDTWERIFALSNENKDDRVKRSKTIPANVFVTLQGAHSAVVVCTEEITGPSVVGDPSSAPRHLGTSTSVFRKVPPSRDWLLVHYHSSLCTAPGDRGNGLGSAGALGKAGGGSSSSGGSASIRITSASSGAGGGGGSGGSSGSGSRLEGAEGLPQHVLDALASTLDELSSGKRGGGGGLLGGDGTSRIIVIGADDDDDDDDEGEGDYGGGGEYDDDEAEGGVRIVSANGNIRQIVRDRARSLALPPADDLAEDGAAPTTRGFRAADEQRQQQRRQQAEAVAAVAARAVRLRTRTVGAVRALAEAGALSPPQKRALLGDVIRHAHAHAVAGVPAGRPSRVEAAYDLLVGIDGDEDEGPTAEPTAADAADVDAHGAEKAAPPSPADKAAAAAAAAAMEAQMARVRRMAVGGRSGLGAGAEDDAAAAGAAAAAAAAMEAAQGALSPAMGEFAQQCRLWADELTA